MAAYAALTSLAQTTHLKTSQLKYPLSIDAQEKIKSIHQYVIFLLSFLQDYPEKANHWEDKIRDVAHEAEDIIEQFMWQQSYYRRMKLSGVNFEEQLRNVAENIGLVVGDLMDQRPLYLPAALSPSSSSASASGSRFGPTSNGAVVGLDGDVMAMKDRLCGLSSRLQVIPIMGMGGIGKTTLARNVCDDPLIMQHFHIRVWLTISQDYSAQRVLLGVLDSLELIEEQMCRDEIDAFTMVEKVYKYLKGRRYLIVMDDVWSTNVFDGLRHAFPDDDNGSRIMLTTRLADVAAYPDFSSPLHEMRFMNDSQSWDLLKGKVFANSICPPELEDIGKKIARNCGGLPLAVVLVAGFLCSVNKTPSSWEEISENVNPIVGQELERILSLSYTHLPHHLRSCFLFIGVFPEDENIHASTLIKLWVAEGFLKHENGCSKSLEEEAEEYLENLVKRNLVIVTRRKSSGKIKCCSIHDMVRDLCLRKARDEKFLRVMDGRVAPQGIVDERRVSLRLFDLDNLWGPNIRTILHFQLSNFPSFAASLRNFRLLRVLYVLGWSGSSEIPSQVFQLFRLRYLALVCPSNIPSDISNLINLQTLIIFQTDYSWKRPWSTFTYKPHFYLPLTIWRMQQLRHLMFYAPCILPHPPYGSDLPLENLQTLSYIKDLVWTEQILQMIPNVKRLGLVYTMNKAYHLHLLKNLHQLEKLELYGLHNFSWKRFNPTFPKTLKELTLEGGEFPWKDIKVIGSLPNLQVLKLRDQIFGEKWETANGEFPQLRYLLIERSRLYHWITESSHFPRLRSLTLLGCSKLKKIPKGIGDIPTLELIEVDYSNESLVKSAKQINEDQQSYGNYDIHVRVSHFHEIIRRRRRH